MIRPLIGITLDQHDQPTRYESPWQYARAVELAGGLPVLLPYRADLSLIPSYLDRLDGILLSGGNDLDPNLYGISERHPHAVPIDPLRQRFELALLAEVDRVRMPTLGICLGAQLMNVHRGGSLHQFLPDLSRDPMLEHRKLEAELRRHSVNIDPASQLGQTIGLTEISVNTYHKQAVNKLGKGLHVSAIAPDGVIEGFEDPSYPLFLAVQWHPERLVDEIEHLAIFRMLVDRSRHSTR